MSFDIWLASKNGIAPVDLDALRTWFSQRPNYALEGPDKKQAFYENEETGVYFWFEFGEVFRPEDAPETERPVEVFLGVNYGRPIPFGMEAARELAAICDYFGFLTCDPQEREPRFSAFQIEEFLSSWRRHAKWAAGSLIKNHGLPARPVAGQILEQMWCWNYERAALERATEIDVFIPRIFLFEAQDRITTGIVWGDGTPTLIPACESICLVREELAPSTFLKFGANDRTELLPREAFDDIWREFYRPDERDPTRLWPHDVERPARLAKALRRLGAAGPKPTILPFDAVIDEELAPND